MTDRERQRQLDLLALQFVAALEALDFEAVERLWAVAGTEPELETILIETAAALAETYEAETQAQLEAAVAGAVEQHLPSAEILRPPAGPLTVAEVAEYLRRHPPAGLTTDEIAANEQLRGASQLVPAELGLRQVLEWGRQFGTLPEAYWRAFRQTALKLRMRRTSDTHYQVAARPAKHKPPAQAPGNQTVSDPRRPFDPTAVVASLRRDSGIPVDPAQLGPVPLARFLEECNLLHAILPQLTRAGIAQYLLREGIAPGNLLEGGDRDAVLAGFLFATGADGYAFASESEPSATEDGEKPKLLATPLGRRRFTLAHELGHFLLHRERMVGGWIDDTRETIREAGGAETAVMEREANQFAAELLMPAEVCRVRAETFRKTYGVCPRRALAYHLSAELLVSSEALRYRLLGLGVGDE